VLTCAHSVSQRSCLWLDGVLSRVCVCDGVRIGEWIY
jgi:hypothetical protein